MKKILLFTALFCVFVFAAIFIIGTYFAPLDLVKNFVTAKLEETFHAPAKIEKISTDIFSGIKLEGVEVASQPGFSEKPLLTVKSINLKYNLWALLLRKLTIHGIEVVGAEFSLEKNAKGSLNLVLSKAAEKKKEESAPLNLLISSLSVKDGIFNYTDYSSGKPKKTIVKNIQGKIDGILLSFLKPMNVGASCLVIQEEKIIPVAINSKIGINLKEQKADASNLSIEIGPEKLAGTLSAQIKDGKYLVNFALGTEKLSVDNLLGIFGVGAAAAAPGKAEKGAGFSIPQNISAKGTLSLLNLYYKKIKIKKVDADVSVNSQGILANVKPFSLYGGTLALKGALVPSSSPMGYKVEEFAFDGFDVAPFSADFIESFLLNLENKKEWKEKFQGTASFSVSGTGKGFTFDQFVRNGNLQAKVSLKNGKFVHLRSLEEVAKALKTPAIAQDIAVKDFLCDAALSSGVLSLSNFSVTDTDIKVSFNGSADLIAFVWQKGNNLKFVFSKDLAAKLPKEYSILKNSQGEAELEVELTGSLKNPVPVPKIQKTVDKVIQKLAPQILDQLREKLVPFIN
ncbi:MAG: AsmA family protein [Candidatus Saganbacteria bacterium]|nr:AsmA family protein [Candidatus Saganbacteria bacterium]